MRLVALGALLFAVYAAGLGIDPAAGEEAAYLRVAAGLVDDGSLAREPQGAGFPLLIAPAEALGGVELFLAAVAALGFVLAALLARRIVPEPYASAGAGLAGLSTPAVAHAGAINPAMTAGTVLVGAALCAVGARERASAAGVMGGAALLAMLPWLDVRFVPAGVPVAIALYVWCRRARRPTLGLIAAEIVGGSLVVYATVNERLYGGPTPGGATGADTLLGHVARAPRVVTLSGELLLWAPALGLAGFAAWLLWRSRRERLARVVPARAGAEAAAALVLAVCGVLVVVAAVLTPSPVGEPFAGRELAAMLPAAGVLVGWGLRHVPSWLGALLGGVTVALCGWVLVA